MHDSFSGVAHGVQPGNWAVVEAQRDDRVDPVEPEEQRRVGIDLYRLKRRCTGVATSLAEPAPRAARPERMNATSALSPDPQ